MLQNIVYIAQIALVAIMVIGVIKWHRATNKIRSEWEVARANLQEIFTEENQKLHAIKLLVPDSKTYEAYIETGEEGVVVESKPCPRCYSAGLEIMMVCRQYWPKCGSPVPYPMEIRRCPQCGGQEKVDLTPILREAVFGDNDMKSTLQVPDEWEKK